MSDAYAAAGVDLGQSDAAVAAIVARLGRIELGRPSRSVLRGGHYASVLRVTDELGVALTTDGVGSKLVVAEQADRLETVGIDCVAMNVNDLICVGAEPIAMLDYLAVEESDPERLGRIAEGLRVGAAGGRHRDPRRRARGRSPSSSAAIPPRAASTCAAPRSAPSRSTRWSPATRSPGRRARRRPLDAACTPTATRSRAARLLSDGRRARASTTARPSSAARPWPTRCWSRRRSTCARSSSCSRSDVPVHGLAHITGGGLDNLKRLHDGVAYRLEEALPGPAGLRARPAARATCPTRRCGGCSTWAAGSSRSCPRTAADEAAAVLGAHHAGARRIGSVRRGRDGRRPAARAPTPARSPSRRRRRRRGRGG